MESLYLLIPLSIALVFVVAIVFWWSVRSGQFEDLEGPGYRVLMDNDRTVEQKSKTSSEFDPGQNVQKTLSSK
jgi:cbb3-type cytochrome oxidase maturation protein